MREPVDGLFPRYSRAAYPVLKLIIGGSMKRLYRIRVEGLENVPAMGNGIVAANHISFLDSFFIPTVVPRRMTYLAKAEYWDKWRTRWLFELGGQIPIRREDTVKSGAALEAGMRVLNRGGLLGIYPEGTRSPDGACYRGKTGVARMAAEANAPVVPVGLVGTREIMPKDRRIPHLRGEVLVRFGKPISIDRDRIGDDPLVLRTFVDELMFHICELSGQEYRDHYAGKEPKPETRELEHVSAA